MFLSYSRALNSAHVIEHLSQEKKNDYKVTELREVNDRRIRVCQYAKGLLISLSSSGNIKTLIIRHLPFSFFPISIILLFLTRVQRLSKIYILLATAPSFGENETHELY